jgi:hypothetical protein
MYKMNLQTENNNFVNQQNLTNVETEKQVDELPNLRQNQDLMNRKAKKTFVIICSFAILAGALTGLGAFKLKNKESKLAQVENVTVADANKVNNGDVFGVQDKDTFADNATGYLEAGGIDGEGSHKLLREGGPSQTVALTSSVVDLDKLVGFEVKLYGETHKAEKAGWFMDVGRVEVINTQAEAPIQTLD